MLYERTRNMKIKTNNIKNESEIIEKYMRIAIEEAKIAITNKDTFIYPI